MKSTLFAAVAAACLGLAAPAHAVIYNFQTFLTGAAESPPNSSAGFGLAFASLDDIAHTLTFDVSFSGLTGTTTMSHVHAPTAVPNTGTTGVATELPSFTGFPLGVQAGTYHHTFDTTMLSTWNPAFVTANGGTALGAEAGFLAAMQQQRAYLNIHTTAVPSGEIRGFLAAVPEPSTWALMIGGFALAGAALRRRRPAQVSG